jgi:oligopeptide/dipeptide ABC transporter ATP-binding protein
MGLPHAGESKGPATSALHFNSRRMTALLDVRDLKTYFSTDEGEYRAVDGVSFQLHAGRTLGIVGESGCGKSVTSLSIMGLVPQPPGRICGGEILLENVDLLKLSPAEMRERRGAVVSMIFQEPMTSLNPAFTVGDQIIEAIQRHRPMSAGEARARAVEMLRKVRIPAPEQRLDEYPHKLSGGMRQRVMIAMALCCDPKLLIADEPTTALDVTIQAQILELMRTLRAEMGTAIILITHDLGVIAEVADDVVVMYAGKIVEQAPVAEIFARPQHPYTIGLLGSLPRPNVEQPRLATIEGTVPNLAAPPPGCRFAPRCPFVEERCRRDEPPLRDLGPGHRAACWRAPLDRFAA